MASMVCKPNSVESGYLSSLFVAEEIERAWGRSEQTVVPRLAPDGVYIASLVAAGAVGSYSAFPSLPLVGRSISVALSLKSPSPVVSRRPVPVVFGLSSYQKARNRLTISRLIIAPK